MRNLLRLLAGLLCISTPALAWEHWGGDRGGNAVLGARADHAGNVGNLVRAWEFRTGDLDVRAPELMKRTKFQATPLFVEDSLIFCSPFNEVNRARSRQRDAEVAIRSEDQHRPASGQPLQLPRRRLLGR